MSNIIDFSVFGKMIEECKNKTQKEWEFWDKAYSDGAIVKSSCKPVALLHRGNNNRVLVLECKSSVHRYELARQKLKIKDRVNAVLKSTNSRIRIIDIYFR